MAETANPPKRKPRSYPRSGVETGLEVAISPVTTPSQYVPRRGGARQIITLEVVNRIADRMGLGLPLTSACAIEDPAINPDSYNDAIGRDAILGEVHRRIMAKWEADAAKILWDGDPAGLKRANGVQFLLERRRPETWAKKPEVSVTNNTLLMGAGVAQDVQRALEKRLAEFAKRDSDPAAIEVESTPAPLKHHKKTT